MEQTIGKELIMKLLKNIKGDANFIIYEYVIKEGKMLDNFRSKRITRKKLEELISYSDIRIRVNEKGQTKNDEIMLNDNISISLEELYNNQYIETKEIEGYTKCVSNVNKYFHIYMKINENDKTVTFKLGDKEKTLTIIENTEYVSRPYYSKYLKCVSIDDLKKQMRDGDSLEKRLCVIGRKILSINKYLEKRKYVLM